MAETAFKHFDIITDHSDHYYSAKHKQNHDGDGYNGKRVYKNIMCEWKILKKNLPEGIYVRVYETRVELMRAVIIGAAGTPYEDGLFFFDIMFPPDYPNHPPQFHFRSHGLSLNPMLKSSGYICLSLLNNWIGWRSSERWDSSRSTILQVLVSIQALVLDERPYYHDHAKLWLTILERIPFLRVTSIYQSYNACIFETTCQLMLYLLKNPPKDFESFIAQHFRRRGSCILRSMAGVYGSFQSDSTKLLYPELVQSFIKIGWVEEEEELLELVDNQEKTSSLHSLPWPNGYIIYLNYFILFLLAMAVLGSKIWLYLFKY